MPDTIEKIEIGEKTVAKRIMPKLASVVGGGVSKGVKMIRIPKGIRHPDSLIHRKELYLPQNPAATPLGRKLEDPMELYFPGRSRLVQDANQVYYYLLQGRDMNELTVLTGLPPNRINAAVNYLMKRQVIGAEQ